MFSVSKITYLLIYYLQQYINIRVVDAILPIIERQIDTWKLGLENILGYHLWHLRKLNHQRRAQFATIFWIAITSRLLRSLPFWQTGMINSFFKSKNVYLSNKIDLFCIKALVLLNCFLLTIVSFLIVSLYNNIVWSWYLIV